MIKLKPSQICTNYKQSNRLVKAGVLSETADMYVYERDGHEYIGFGSPDSEAISHKALPAWSLDRLIDMLPKKSMQFSINLEICGNDSEDNPIYTFDGHEFEDFSGAKNIYDATIELIETLIKTRFFEYVDWSKKDGNKVTRLINRIIKY